MGLELYIRMEPLEFCGGYGDEDDAYCAVLLRRWYTYRYIRRRCLTLKNVHHPYIDILEELDLETEDVYAHTSLYVSTFPFSVSMRFEQFSCPPTHPFPPRTPFLIRRTPLPRLIIPSAIYTTLCIPQPYLRLARARIYIQLGNLIISCKLHSYTTTPPPAFPQMFP